jgi:hypothetical protein
MAGMFRPEEIEEFRFVGYDFDESTGLANFTYAFDDVVTFVETFRFPVPAAWAEASEERKSALDRALFVLFLVTSVSYYKAAIPERAVIDGPITAKELNFLKLLYEKGLGEFAYVNQVDVRDRPMFDVQIIDERELQEIGLRQRSLVPVGGGKDSCVSIELLRDSGEEVTLTSVNKARAIMDVIKAAELPSLHIERVISSELLRINNEGALNGHIPVTAVVSMAMIVTAILNDYDAVVMSNERSASVGNVEWHGQLVNHQWSKSLEAEMALAEVIRTSVAPDLNYFSLLRPLSEVGITKRFAKLERYFDVFTSCNRAFRIDETKRVHRWCTDCPKCRFVYLALAPFMNNTRLAGIFEKDMLRETDQIEGFDALIGWNAHKPFECVGEVEESVAAFLLLTKDVAWRDYEIVRRFETEILPQLSLPPDVVKRVLEPSTIHAIPERFKGVHDAAQ